jgi:hypothetical protein
MTIPTQAKASELTVTTTPSQADAQLIVQLGQLGQAMRIDHGQALLWKYRDEGGLSFEKFEATYPVDSDNAVAILNVLKWYETVGTLVKQGLLDRGLVYDLLWVSGMWDLSRGIAIGQRGQVGEPAIWENFEALAAGQT